MPRVVESPKKRGNAVVAKDEEVEVAAKRGRGRPKHGDGEGTVKTVSAKDKASNPMTKIVDGKLMKRAPGKRKVATGKRGRPRKEYTWIESEELPEEVEDKKPGKK